MGGRQTSLGDLCQRPKIFVRLKEAPKQTLCSLPDSDRLYILSNSLPKTILPFQYLSIWYKEIFTDTLKKLGLSLQFTKNMRMS